MNVSKWFKLGQGDPYQLQGMQGVYDDAQAFGELTSEVRLHFTHYAAPILNVNLPMLDEMAVEQSWTDDQYDTFVSSLTGASVALRVPGGTGHYGNFMISLQNALQLVVV